MDIITPRESGELKECIELYYVYNANRVFTNADLGIALATLCSLIAGGAKLRAIKENGKIIAWILYKVRPHDFSRDLMVQQLYYCSLTSKVKSVRCLLALHRDMITYGRSCKANLGISTCSHEDTTFQLCRILAKDGWETHGYLAKFSIQ